MSMWNYTFWTLSLTLLLNLIALLEPTTSYILHAIPFSTTPKLKELEININVLQANSKFVPATLPIMHIWIKITEVTH